MPNDTRIPNTHSPEEVRRAFASVRKKADILNDGAIGEVLVGTGAGILPAWGTELTALTKLTVDDITIDGAVISSGTGAISFVNENLTTTGTIAGINVTSGADPGHTHTIYLKADGSVELTGDMAVVPGVTIDGRDLRLDGQDLDLLVQIIGKMKVDSSATVGYLGAASNDGVLRTSTGITFTDGGNFVTLTTNDGEIHHGSLAGIGDDDHTAYHTDGRAATWLSAGHETTYNHANFATAYGWGNHAGLYDAAGTAAAAVSTHESTYNHANYDIAYGWGDHAAGGYLKADGTVPLTADWATGVFSIIATDHIFIRADYRNLYFGESNDATIYYNGTHLYINPQVVGSGKLYVQAGDLELESGRVYIKNNTLHVGGNGTNTTAKVYASLNTTDTSQPLQGVLGAVNYGSSGSGNMTNVLYGGYFQVDVNGTYDGDISKVFSFYGITSHYGSGTLAEQIGVQGRAHSPANKGPITDQYGVIAWASGHATARVTNSYGLYVKDVSHADTLNYAIYTNAGLVHLGDAVEILGDLTFVGAGSGMVYGAIYSYDVNDTVDLVAGIGNKVQITSFTTNGPSNLTTPAHGTDDITIVKSGDYAVKICIHAESDGGAARQVGFGVYTNNGTVQYQALHAHQDFAGGGGETHSVSICGIATFSAGDTVEIWAWNTSGATDIIIDDISFSVLQVGGD